MTLKIINIIRLTITTLAPVGASKKYDRINPIAKAMIDMNTLLMTTPLKVLDICIAESVGNIIRLDIKSDPINFIPNTTTIEQIIATTIL